MPSISRPESQVLIQLDTWQAPNNHHSGEVNFDEHSLII